MFRKWVYIAIRMSKVKKVRQIPENVEDRNILTIDFGRCGRFVKSPSNIRSYFFSTSLSNPLFEAENPIAK